MHSVIDFMKMKQAHKKITMVTCYDYSSAKILERTQVDCILVGDTLAMVMHGFKDTTYATVELMQIHTAAVARAIRSKFIIADLPFLSYRKSLTETMNAVAALMQAGAHAIKLEGVEGNLDTIQYIVESGVPVMGHIGLTPQHIHALGGFKVQGKGESAQAKLLAQAKELEAAGCFAMVLECVPAIVAQTITKILHIPTIGIGAGADTDGQVLVFQDLLGLQSELKPKFVKNYLQGEALLVQSINQYVDEVSKKMFPGAEHTY